MFDGQKILITGVEFRYNTSCSRYELVDRDYDNLELICIAESFLRYVESINIKGFITAQNLQHGFMSNIIEHLCDMGFKRKILGNSELTYTMWHNFMFLNIYYLITKRLKDLGFYRTSSLKSIDTGSYVMDEVILTLDVLKGKIHARLDQYIKSQIQCRGITVMENSYIGFDTEYQFHEKFKNRLLSTQTAVQRRTILKIPLVKPFDISYINPLSSEISNTYKNKEGVRNKEQYTFVDDPYESSQSTKKDINELLIINNSIKSTIEQTRECMFNSIDFFNSSLIEKLSSLKGAAGFDEFDFYEDSKRNQMIFFFPLTSMFSAICFPRNNEFSFDDLLSMSKGNGSKKTEFDGIFLYDNENPPSNPNDKSNSLRKGKVPSLKKSDKSLKSSSTSTLHPKFDE